VELVELLEKLSNACGVAGREDEVRSLMKEWLGRYADEVREDKLGNVICVRKGAKGAPKVMIAAHMDEIGLIVKNITDKGFVQFAKLGGIDDRVLVAQRVLIHTSEGPVPGIIGSKPPHILKEEERKKVITYEELFIDIGARSREEAEKEIGVRIGDPISFDIKFARLHGDLVVGKAFDDRVGCAALIEVMRNLPDDLECTVYAVGTVQEEVGLRGATVAAYGIYPDVALAIDVTVAGDVPGVKEVEAPVKVGKGPSITIADAGLIAHPKVIRWLLDTAEAVGVPYQLETGLPGTTDAARIALTREGVPCGVVSVPTRYIHSPSSVLSLEDVRNAVKLVVEALKNVGNYF